MSERILGIDIGGSHIKAMLFSETGDTIQGRSRLVTPIPATPEAVMQVIEQLAADFNDITKVAAGFPGFVKDSVIYTAPNLGTAYWQGINLADLITAKLGKPALVVNDADFQGAGLVSGRGLEMVITLGTGFGTALLQNGRLLPHLELSHHPITKSKNYDQYIGQAALLDVGKHRWNNRMQRVLAVLKTVFNYDHLYISGGNAEKLQFQLDENVSVASNEEGLKGAAALWRS